MFGMCYILICWKKYIDTGYSCFQHNRVSATKYPHDFLFCAHVRPPKVFTGIFTYNVISAALYFTTITLFSSKTCVASCFFISDVRSPITLFQDFFCFKEVVSGPSYTQCNISYIIIRFIILFFPFKTLLLCYSPFILSEYLFAIVFPLLHFFSSLL